MHETIMLVEDDEDLRVLVALGLHREGYEVLEAADGVEALQRLEQGRAIDLVIADLMMPRMDGLELCARLQERPELVGVPFLLLTGRDGSEAQYLGLRAGADDYIAKPVRFNDLLARVRGRLERRARQRALPARPPSLPPLSGHRWCPQCGRRGPEALCPNDGIEMVLESGPHGTRHGPGDVVAGRFRLERAIGQGAMGSVYVATQLSIGRSVALKLLHHGLLGEEAEVRRFHQEARAASRIDHPNVVSILDFGVDEATGTPFIAMALLSGRTLRDLLREGPLALPSALHLLEDIARGLAAAHAAGVVHRDLKAENVMVQRRDDGELQVTVLDFGVAQVAQNPARLTARGALVGTPETMSPEQASGEPVGPASDLYSLGCLLHEMLTGRPPFDGRTLAELLHQHLYGPAPDLPDRLPRGEKVPEPLRRLHRGLLAKTPAERPSDALEVVRVAVDLRRARVGGSDALQDPLSRVPRASVSLQPTLANNHTLVRPRAPTKDFPGSRWPPKRIYLIGAALIVGGLMLGGAAICR